MTKNYGKLKIEVKYLESLNFIGLIRLKKKFKYIIFL